MRARERTQIQAHARTQFAQKTWSNSLPTVSQCLGQVITWRADECHSICDNNNPRLGASVTVFATITDPAQHGQSLYSIVTADRFLCTRTRCAKPVLKASEGHFCGCLLQARYIYAAAYYKGDGGIIASEASLLHELAGAFLWYNYIFVSMGTFGPAWAPRNAQRANVGPAG